MRYKTIALTLALTVASWAQTATSNPQAGSTSTEQAKCACCDKMATADGQSCARHMAQSANGKQTAACCTGKKEKSCCGKDAQCMKGDKATCCSADDKEKTASSCCGADCSKKCAKGCCSGKTEKAARNCCHNTLQS